MTFSTIGSVAPSSRAGAGSTAVVRTLQRELGQLTREPVEGFTIEPDQKVTPLIDLRRGCVVIGFPAALGHLQVASGDLRTAGHCLPGRVLQGRDELPQRLPLLAAS